MYLILFTLKRRARQLSDYEEEDAASSPVKTGKQAANDSVDQTSQISTPAKQTPPRSQASGSW